jgi:hypothetical protein
LKKKRRGGGGKEEENNEEEGKDDKEKLEKMDEEVEGNKRREAENKNKN